jgi:hypothetical protein
MYKRNFYIIGLVLSCLSCYAEDSIPVKNEILVTQDRIGTIGNSIKYGCQLNERYWFKIGVNLFGDYTNRKPKYNTGSYQTGNSELCTSLVLGIDQHTKKLKRIDVVKGINLRFSFIQQGNYNDNPYVEERLRAVYHRYLWAGIGFTFGMYYCVSESFSIGSEINPYIQYRFYKISPSDYDNVKTYSIEYEVLSNVSILSLRYRW